MLDIPAPSNPERVWLLAMPVFYVSFRVPDNFGVTIITKFVA